MEWPSTPWAQFPPSLPLPSATVTDPCPASPGAGTHAEPGHFETALAHAAAVPTALINLGPNVMVGGVGVCDSACTISARWERAAGAGKRAGGRAAGGGARGVGPYRVGVSQGAPPHGARGPLLCGLGIGGGLPGRWRELEGSCFESWALGALGRVHLRVCHLKAAPSFLGRPLALPLPPVLAMAAAPDLCCQGHCSAPSPTPSASHPLACHSPEPSLGLKTEDGCVEWGLRELEGSCLLVSPLVAVAVVGAVVVAVVVVVMRAVSAVRCCRLAKGLTGRGRVCIGAMLEEPMLKVMATCRRSSSAAIVPLLPPLSLPPPPLWMAWVAWLVLLPTPRPCSQCKHTARERPEGVAGQLCGLEGKENSSTSFLPKASTAAILAEAALGMYGSLPNQGKKKVHAISVAYNQHNCQMTPCPFALGCMPRCLEHG